MDGTDQYDENDDNSGSVAANIQDNDDVNDAQGNNQQVVNQIKQRIQQVLPNLQAMAQFEGMLKQNVQLAQMLAAIVPEMIVAFVQVAQQMQGGAQNPGQAQGAQAPSGPPGSQQDTGGAMPQQQQPGPGQSPPGAPMLAGVGSPSAPPGPPAATTTGNPPPSTPDQSGLRRQFFTGR